LERSVESRQAVFFKPKPINKATRPVIASYVITEILGMKKKHLECGNVIKESLVVASDSLLNYLK
jgi:hypothetical protein